MKRLVLIAWVALLGSSCNFNEFETDNLVVENYQGTVGIPVGEFEVTFRRLFEDLLDSSQNLIIDNDSIFVLVYEDSLSFSNSSDLITIDDISNGTSVTLTEIPASPVSQQIPIDQTFTFNYQPQNGEAIDSLVYESGELVLRVNSSLESVVDFQFDILNTVDLSNNDTPVSFTGSVGANSSVNRTQDLANHATFLTTDGNLNTFEVQLTGTINLEAGQFVSATDVLSFNLTFRNQNFQAIFGFFGQDALNVGNNSIDVSFFQDFGTGIIFERPEMQLQFENSYGLPIGLDLSGISGDVDGQNVALSGTITESLQVVNSPDITQVGQSVRDTILLDNQNSSLADLLAASPDVLNFNLTATTNPQSINATNFITNQDTLKTVVQMRLPLSVQFDNVERQVDFGIETDLNLSDVDSAGIRFVTENQLPFNAALDLIFKDADSIPLDTVQGGLFLASPFINREGRVIEGEVNIANLPLNKDALNAFQNSAILTLVLTLNTPETLNSQEIFVDILSQYTLEMKVSLVVKLNVDI